MAKTCWGVSGRRILEENFLSSQCSGFFSFLGTSFCELYKRESRWNEFHLLVGDSY